MGLGLAGGWDWVGLGWDLGVVGLWDWVGLVGLAGWDWGGVLGVQSHSRSLVNLRVLRSLLRGVRVGGGRGR